MYSLTFSISVSSEFSVKEKWIWFLFPSCIPTPVRRKDSIRAVKGLEAAGAAALPLQRKTSEAPGSAPPIARAAVCCCALSCHGHKGAGRSCCSHCSLLPPFCMETVRPAVRWGQSAQLMAVRVIVTDKKDQKNCKTQLQLHCCLLLVPPIEAILTDLIPPPTGL